MSKDDLKRRIEALNRKPMKNMPAEDSHETKALQRKTSTFPKVNYPPFVRLEDTIDGTVTEAPVGPGYYHIEKNADDLEDGAKLLYKRFISLTGYPNGYAAERLQNVCKAGQISPGGLVFLDLETCGLGMCSVFLVGTMECTQNGLVFKQYFARDYSEEASIVSAISERLAKTELMITFNGKTFDAPFLRNRANATGVKLHEPKAHLDLLYESRRIYKNKLPNCKLQTLERMICGRYREDDIPGSEIPAAYREYVKTGNASKVSRILLHNLYDLLTMADLMAHMWPE